MQTGHDLLHGLHLRIDLIPFHLRQRYHIRRRVRVRIRAAIVPHGGGSKTVAAAIATGGCEGGRRRWELWGRDRGGGRGRGRKGIRQERRFRGVGGWRTAVRAAEVALDAVATGHIAIASDLARSAGQTRFTLARPAPDRIDRHSRRLVAGRAQPATPLLTTRDRRTREDGGREGCTILVRCNQETVSDWHRRDERNRKGGEIEGPGKIRCNHKRSIRIKVQYHITPGKVHQVGTERAIGI